MIRILFLAVMGFTCLIGAPSFASETAPFPVQVSNPYAFATAPAQKSGGAFFTITNGLNEARQIVSAAADVSEVVELHTHIMENDVMMMRKIEAIDLPAGEETHLEPMGLHIMLIGLKAPLEEGSTFPLTLTLDNEAELIVEVPVVPAGQKPTMSEEQHEHEHHHDHEH